MNNSLACEQREDKTFSDLPSHWFASIAPVPPAHHLEYNLQLITGAGHEQGLYLGNQTNLPAPLSAARASCGVIFAGNLHNGRELRRELGEFLAPTDRNEAELVLAAYLKWGEKFLPRLRGAFALIISDSEQDGFLCLRDPVGTCPLFFTKTQGGILLSTSIDVLVRQPQVNANVNRAALADFFLDRFPNLEETFFESVKRVPPGHVLRVTRQEERVYRYWDPAPDGTVKWLTQDEVAQFDELLDQAVRRCLSVGPAGIFLSGGLDSVSVAAVAAEVARADGLPKPWGLSLVFPGTDVDEEIIQRGAAEHLGLPQVLKPFHDAVQDKLLAEAVAINASLPAPILNTWWPAYDVLIKEGQKRGCRTILTGTGGDEWLGVSPYLASDLLREGNFSGVYRLWQSSWRSFNRPKLYFLRSMVWTFGIGPLVVPPLHRSMKRMAPSVVGLPRRIFAPPPNWLAPDKALRRELKDRWEQKSLRESHADASGSLYIREMKLGLDHPLVSWELEEQFHFNRNAGVHVAHPLWDPDLVDMLYRTPPMMLIQEGRTKGLIRTSLARRFPNLGFEQQRKVEGTRFYSSLIYRQARELWQQLGGTPTLGKLGIVDERSIEQGFEHFLTRQKQGDAHHAWSILNLEAWARAHTS
jgi:asparagine synthase (glutamine-hydrolysing)